MTLKSRSRSPNSIQFFVLSHFYLHETLVRIQPQVQKLLCRKESVFSWICTKNNAPPPPPTHTHTHTLPTPSLSKETQFLKLRDQENGLFEKCFLENRLKGKRVKSKQSTTQTLYPDAFPGKFSVLFLQRRLLL